MRDRNQGNPSIAPLAIGSAVTGFAPGGIGNMGPGLDILGCAVTGAGDRVCATRVTSPGVRILEPGHPELPREADRHTAAIAATQVLAQAGASDVGVELRVVKGLPLCGGQGGSSASGIAGAVAVNALLGEPLDRSELLAAALAAEERVAGRHIDNLAPSLFGGILLIRSIEPLDVVRLPVPDALRIVLVHPAQRVRTRDARAVLPDLLPRATAMAQAAAVADMAAAFCSGDLRRLRGAVDDRIAEPARARLLPGFASAKRAALDAGALGCSISGAGPSLFAFADSDTLAEEISAAVCAAYAREGLEATGRVARVDTVGARVVDS